MSDGRSGVSAVSVVASPLEEVGESGRADALGLRRTSKSAGSVEVGVSDLMEYFALGEVLKDWSSSRESSRAATFGWSSCWK